MPAAPAHSHLREREITPATDTAVPSWIVGLAGVAAVASLLFTTLLFLNL
jgi:hypothetical protein